MYPQNFYYAGYETFCLKITCSLFLSIKFDGNKTKSVSAA